MCCSQPRLVTRPESGNLWQAAGVAYANFSLVPETTQPTGQGVMVAEVIVDNADC